MITNPAQSRLAIVTALPKEFAAVEVMLDQHDDITVPGDSVRYTVGSIGPHPVVVTLLPKMGNNPATAVSSNLLRSFPTISDILMVGIAGGVPDPGNVGNHVRLGDIVISMDAGVMQFDLGKLEQVVPKGEALREYFTIRAIDPPPSARLQQAARFLEARRIRREQPWEQYITRATALENSARPPNTKDLLYDSHDPNKVIPHPKDAIRISRQPKLHYGLIGSSNTLLKEPRLRDWLRDEYKIRAIEMEGSGIATATWMSGNTGYLLIRGICDYCDSHKNDMWQGYAAAVAAAYARALIESIPVDTSMMYLHDQFAFPSPITIATNSSQLPRINPPITPPLENERNRNRADELQKKLQTILRDHAVIDHTELFGVNDIIEKLREQLMNPHGDWVISLSGEGGIGKTALAYEIISRYAIEAGFTRIAWVSAKTAQFLPSGELLRKTSAEFHWTTVIKKVADQLDLDIGYSAIEWINNFHKSLRKMNDRCLIVLDNLETLQDIAEAIQYLCGITSYQLPHSHKLLITTRYSVLSYTPNIIETELRGLKAPYAFQLIRSIGNEDIKNASEEELYPILDATERNPFLIKLCVKRFLVSHLSLEIVLQKLKAANELIGKNVITYLYSESLSVLERKCGEKVAKQLMAAFCPLGTGNPVDYQSLFKYSQPIDENIFSSALETACNLSLIRASNLNKLYSIHGLLWNYLCNPTPSVSKLEGRN